jgi:hypothetical protein
MIERIQLCDEIFENEKVCSIITTMFELEDVGLQKEHREEMVKRFWRSLSDEDIEAIGEEEESAVVMTLLLRCLLFENNPFELNCEIDSNTLSTEVVAVVRISVFESLLRGGFIISNGEYFYNPFSQNDNAEFTLPEKGDLLTTQEDKLNSLLS